jgi:hypothetical protein
LPISSDILKDSLESLESFDKQASNNSCKLGRYIIREFAFLDFVEKGKRGLPLDPSEPGFDDQQLLRQAARNVLKGPLDLRSEIQREIEVFEYIVKPLFEETFFYDYEIFLSLGFIEAIKSFVHTIPKRLRERLEKQPRFEEIDSEFQSAKELLERVKHTLRMISKTNNKIQEYLKPRDVIEILRRVVSIRPLPPNAQSTEITPHRTYLS